jgi:hypothetical protein
MRLLRSLIRDKANPKMLDKRPVNGSMLCMLAQTYVNAVNAGDVPSIRDAWSSVCEAECSRIAQKCILQYENEANELRTRGMPVGCSQLARWHAERKASTMSLFAQCTHTFEAASKDAYSRNIKDRLASVYERLCVDNERTASTTCTELLQKLYADVDTKVSRGEYKEWSKYEKDRLDVRSAYLKQAPDLTSNKRILAEFMETHVSQAASRMTQILTLEVHKVGAEQTAERQREALAAKRDMHALDMQILELKSRV